GRTILSCDPPLDVTTGEAQRIDNLPQLGPVDQVLALPDGQRLLVRNAEGVLVWDTLNGKKLRLLDDPVDDMILSRDGKSLIVNNGSLQRIASAMGLGDAQTRLFR